MRIGELAERTGVSTRMLRYYEEQQLLAPGRGQNGYRDYSEGDIGRVEQVRNLLAAGMPSRFIRAVLDFEQAGAASRLPAQVGEVHAYDGWTPSCSAGFADQLREELDRLERHVSCLQRSRDTVRRYLQQVAEAA